MDTSLQIKLNFPVLFQDLHEKSPIFKEFKDLEFIFAIFQLFKVFQDCYEYEP